MTDEMPGPARLAEQIRSGKTTSVEATTACLRRIEDRNDEVNAIICPATDALARAQAADEALRRGGQVGPLHGVPFTVKDTLAVAGYPATAGSKVLAGYVPDRTAPAVQRLLDAGGIFLGKANCSEFAVDTHAGNLLFGDTHNPWMHDRTPGGSSGGDAAAVAAGMASFGIGTDLGGSVRWPAHCTGTSSLRPTLGRIPGTGVLPFDTGTRLGPPNSGSMLHRYMSVGPIARSAEDLELLAGIMSGPDDEDAQAVPVHIPSMSAVDPSSLAVAWCDGEGTVPVRDDVVAAVKAAATSLESVVRKVREIRPPRLHEAADLFVRLRDLEGLPEVATAIARSAAPVTEGIRTYLTSVQEGLAGMDATQLPATVMQVTATRDAVQADTIEFLQEWPILLLPVASVTAPAIGTRSVTIGHTTVPWSQLGSCSRAISILRLPAAVTPFGYGEDGMPIGIQVVGRPFRDHEVLAVAHQLELLAAQAPGSPRTDHPAGVTA